MRSTSSKFVGLAAVAVTLALGACGTPPQQASGPSAKASNAPSGPAQQSQAPTPTPSPTPTVDPTALKPGTNHNNAAQAYVYEAKDVQACLLKDKKGSSASPAPQPAGTCPDKKIAFLTFDDGPTNSTTPQVLDILKEQGAHATFFYIAGPQALEKADPAIVKRTIAEGHSIDIHTYSHNYKTLYPGGRGNAQAIVEDREKALKSIRGVLGDDYDVHGYRYPGGHLSWKSMDAADKALADKGVYWIDWNSMNGDAESKAPSSPSMAAEFVKATMKASGDPQVAVVLMHDFADNSLTLGSLEEIITNFKNKGYEFGVIN